MNDETRGRPLFVYGEFLCGKKIWSAKEALSKCDWLLLQYGQKRILWRVYSFQREELLVYLETEQHARVANVVDKGKARAGFYPTACYRLLPWGQFIVNRVANPHKAWIWISLWWHRWHGKPVTNTAIRLATQLHSCATFGRCFRVWGEYSAEFLC